MEFINIFVDYFLHLDTHLTFFFNHYGWLTYLILFLIIFAETGLVVTPFLPGDSLLFAVGALCAVTSLNIYFLLILLPLAAILGDNTNYWIGHWFAPKLFKNKDSKIFKQQYLDKAHDFYDKYGPIAITLCRFMPILRTFVPFASGMAKMKFGTFTLYNILGGILWTTLLLLLGFFFGNMPFVKEHFEFVIVGIIIFSVLPIVFEFVKAKFKTKNT